MHPTPSDADADPPGLRERKKARTREAIYQAAVDLFRERGYDEASVDDIARRAEVSRATVFNYFGTKRALLVEYRRRLDGRLPVLERRLLNPDLNVAAARARVERFFQDLAGLAEREGTVYRSLVRHVLTRRSPPDESTRGRTRRLAAALAEALERGKDRGELRPFLDTHLAARTLLRLWTSALVAWANADRGTALGERVQEMVGLLFDGLEARSPSAESGRPPPVRSEAPHRPETDRATEAGSRRAEGPPGA